MAPELLVNPKLTEPFVRIFVPVKTGGVAMGTLMVTILPVLGMPFAKIVTSEWPGGKFQTGPETKELVVQLVLER